MSGAALLYTQSTSALHAEGRRFEPVTTHQPIKRILNPMRIPVLFHWHLKLEPPTGYHSNTADPDLAKVVLYQILYIFYNLFITCF